MVLFEFNDVFAQFMPAFTTKFGDPGMMTEEQLDACMVAINHTDFYDNLVPEESGWTVLQWARTYKDGGVGMLLKNEKVSPSWVNQRKYMYADAQCAARGIPRLSFNVCRTDAEFQAHSKRGVLVTGSIKNSQIWEAAGNQRAVVNSSNTGNTPTGSASDTTIQMIKNFDHQYMLRMSPPADGELIPDPV